MSHEPMNPFDDPKYDKMVDYPKVICLSKEECKALINALDNQWINRDNELAYKALQKISNFADGK